MPITHEQIEIPKRAQEIAAHDNNQTVRLVAGPGTGKSYVIEGRVQWLLSDQKVPPESIIVVSFTRAASKDLKERIKGFCLAHNQTNVTGVRVSTLHSLALYILRRTGNLNTFPTDPIVMDDWELNTIFDAEFGHINNINYTRCGEIRRDHEAFWSTGNWNPPNLPIPRIPITEAERNSFEGFYGIRTQTYSCVLPGEIVRMCVTQIQAGLIDPVLELGVQHLIIDEVQDLNPCDFDFIDLLIQRGVNVFICGDDDQSVYSFRYAFPQGIQNFTTKYPKSTTHVLTDCFRCTTSVLNAAVGVITHFPAQNRIAKNIVSLYSNSNPVNNGFVQVNTFKSANQEAAYIANSCQALINLGVSQKDLMILLSNRKIQLKHITDALDNLEIGYDANQGDTFKDTSHGRFLLGLLRIIENTNDYIAYRVILGTPNKIGLTTSCEITSKVIDNIMNYRNIFYYELPSNIFSKRETSAINKAKSNLIAVQGWNLSDTIDQKTTEIEQLILTNFTQNEVDEWKEFIIIIPPEMTLLELKEYMQTDSQATKDKILNSIFERLNQLDSKPEPILDKIRITSFHSSKGLSAKIVFIPGLEEIVFPNPFTQQVPGLILESARLLYVAITRAKAACIISHTQWRRLFGKLTPMKPSRFCSTLGNMFVQQTNNSLSITELQEIQTSIMNL